MTDILVEREVRIHASPATIYGFLTDPEKVVAWMGHEAIFEARPGGVFRIDYNGTDIVSGEVIEVVENERVAVTWGWEAEGAATPVGASIVEFTLTPDDEGTVLRLVHRGLAKDEARSHGEGWDYFLPKLASAVK
jgi:uncharacterized protein YndB with AHSA1/START domain